MTVIRVGTFSKQWLKRGKTRKFLGKAKFRKEWVSYDGCHYHVEAYPGAGMPKCALDASHIRIK